MSECVTQIRHTINEQVGTDADGDPIYERVNSVKYEFTDKPSAEAKDAVRNHIPKLLNKREVVSVIESVDS